MIRFSLTFLCMCVLFVSLSPLSGEAADQMHVSEKQIFATNNNLLSDVNPTDPLGYFGQKGSSYASDMLKKHVGLKTVSTEKNTLTSWLVSYFKTIPVDAVTQRSQAALQSGQLPSADGITTDIVERTASKTIDTAVGVARETGLPFLKNIEVQHRIQKDSKPEFSVRTIDALYESKDLRHTTFAEGGLAREGDRTTLNLGVGYRFMNEDETWLYGVNAFYDQQFPYDHKRASIGLEATSVDFGIFSNHYIPVSNWQDTRTGYQEKTLGGWDIGVTGRLPVLPEMELTTTGYIWDQYEGAPNKKGFKFNVAYTPIPQITVGATLDHGSDGETQQNVFIRYNFNAQKRERELHPRSVADLRLKAVNRENRLLVQERQKPSLTGTVAETIGSNSVTSADVSQSLTVGQKIIYGSIITVANSGGAYAELHFGDGGVLRIGTNSQVRVDLGLITLISGVMQYVSGSTNVLINTPGGNVVLNGTDIDIVSNGSTSTVRVRDGNINASGMSANPGDIVALSGSPGLLAPGSGPYNSHRSNMYARLDSIDPLLLNIPKAAPYVYRSVSIEQAPASVGDPLVLGIAFSKPVSLVGGVSLNFEINGTPRTATYSSGNGSNKLLFTYTTAPADAGEDTIEIDQVSLNGGSIASGVLPAVDYVPSTSVPIDSGPIVSTNVGVTVSTSAGSTTSVSPIPFTIVFDAAVTGLLANELTVVNGTASNLLTSDNITWTVDITPTAQGTVSVQVPASVAQDGSAHNNSISNTVSVVYNTGAPSGYAVNFTSDPINAANQTASAFEITNAEIGTTYNYTITSSGGGTAVTGTGTVNSTTQNITNVDVSGLNDGTLTVSLTLTSTFSTVGPAVIDTVMKDLIAPTITSVTPPGDGVYDDL